MSSAKCTKAILWIGIIIFALHAQDRLSKSQSQGLIFSHEFHTVEQEIECQTCHQGALKSTSGKDDLLPDMDTCADCHDVEDENDCTKCHTDADNVVLMPRIDVYSPKFSHEKHLKKGLECKTCHASIVYAKAEHARWFPTMEQCQTCHQKQTVLTECNDCHMPGEKLKPVSHKSDFRHTHATLARIGTDPATQKDCRSCHQEKFCQDCHEGDNLSRRTHPLNFEFTHSFEALGKEKQCLSCHQSRVFCAECHEENNVMPHSHTAGWAVPEVGGRHVQDARADFAYCMTCHEQEVEEMCGKCHGNK